MFNIFGKEASTKDKVRENDQGLRKASREIDREMRKLDMEEKKLQMEIKKKAMNGENDMCRVLAKQLVALRKQRNRIYDANGKISSVRLQNKTMGATVALADAMATTSKTVASMNKTVKVEGISKTLNDFKRANMQMEMTDELVNDTLDDLLEESGDEEESNNLISRVLDEIGIEISDKMARTPQVSDAVGSQETSKKGIKVDVSKLTNN